jgi:hypothetical protein
VHFGKLFDYSPHTQSSFLNSMCHSHLSYPHNPQISHFDAIVSLCVLVEIFGRVFKVMEQVENETHIKLNVKEVFQFQTVPLEIFVLNLCRTK